MEITYTLAELPQVAAWLWPHLQHHKVAALHGDMGVGKTTLIAALCRHLQVADVVSSPTFSIINEYRWHTGGGTIYHIDLYRLQREEDAVRAGVEDCLYSGQYCWIEWPERAPALLPPGTLHLHLALQEAGRRRLAISHK